jgi:hypothetical protein
MMYLSAKYTKTQLSELPLTFGTGFIKAVVDVSKGQVTIDAELHSDLEDEMLQNGSKQEDLWGINLYPSAEQGENFIEFDSMINIRPRQNNRGRGVEDAEIRDKITSVVYGFVIDE